MEQMLGTQGGRYARTIRKAMLGRAPSDQFKRSGIPRRKPPSPAGLSPAPCRPVNGRSGQTQGDWPEQPLKG